MRFTLEVSMANIEGALERVLGRLRQRGFVVCALTAACTPNFSHMNARITLESTRCLDLALKQLIKLCDVEDVVVCSAEEHVPEPITKVRHASDFDLIKGGHELAFKAYRHHGHISQYEVRKGH